MADARAVFLEGNLFRLPWHLRRSCRVPENAYLRGRQTATSQHRQARRAITDTWNRRFGCFDDNERLTLPMIRLGRSVAASAMRLDEIGRRPSRGAAAGL